MSDTVLLALIGAVVVLIIFLVSVFVFRDRIKSIEASAEGIKITLADKETARQNLMKAAQGKAEARTDEVSLQEAEHSIANLTTKLQKTILWVDDYPSNNTYEVETLKPLGANVVQVRSNEDAYKEIAKSKPSLVITDIGRDNQKTDGMDLISTLSEQHPDLPVIVYTGFGAAQNKKADALERGARGITALPSELIRLIIGQLQP